MTFSATSLCVAVGLLAQTAIADSSGSFQVTKDKFSAFWYIPNVLDNSTVKFQFQLDFGAAIDQTSNKWAGMGIRTAGASSMGPGEFYTGQTDTLSVTPRYLASGSDYPPAVNTTTVIDSSCSIESTKLICNVWRYLTPDSSAASSSIDLTKDVDILFAFGDLDSGDISFHNDNYGTFDSIKISDKAARPATVSPKELTASWMPLPADASIDFFIEHDFSGSDKKLGSSWIGIAVSPQQDSMGPGEFYTGQGDTLAITNRWLASGADYPPQSDTPDIDSSNCLTSGSSSDILTCTFNRPLKTSKSTQVRTVLLRSRRRPRTCASSPSRDSTAVSLPG